MASLPAAHPFDVAGARRRLAASGGGYELVHKSPGLEIGVYVLVAPEPDGQQPHEYDEVYVVLEGTGVTRSRASRSSCASATPSSSRPWRTTASARTSS